MSKHQLFMSNSYSPLGSAENSTIIESGRAFESENMTPDRGEKKKPANKTPTQVHPANLLKTPASVTTTPARVTKTQLKNVPKKNINVTETPNRPPPCKQSLSIVEESSDSDSDFKDINFFSKFNLKLPYSMEEDEFILQYVLKGQNIFKVSSILLWKHLEAKKNNPKRTYQSLKNRFLRNIKPVIFTTFRHMIKNKATTNMILTKFPELKKQMRINETLGRIQIPTRKPLTAVTSSSASVSEKKQPEEAIQSSQFIPISTPVQSQQSTSSKSDSPKTVNLYRHVTLSKNSIKVLVNLQHRNFKIDRNTVPLLLNERFKKTKIHLGPFLCPVCGHGSSGSNPADSSDEESVIPNSVETMRANQKRKIVDGHSSSRKKINSKGSQSLLTYQDDKDDENVKNAGTSQVNGSESRKHTAGPIRSCVTAESQKSIGVTAKVNSQKESSRTQPSSKDPNSWQEKEYDSDIDVIYENTMAGFRKLISADEEKQLLKKCLYKYRDTIGLNFDSEKNLDSFFLESSPDAKTPEFTNEYSTAPSANDGTAVRESQQNDSSMKPSMMKRKMKS